MHSSRMRTAHLLTVSQHALRRVDVYPSMQWGRPPPCGQTDTCENITSENFICGR